MTFQTPTQVCTIGSLWPALKLMRHSLSPESQSEHSHSLSTLSPADSSNPLCESARTQCSLNQPTVHYGIITAMCNSTILEPWTTKYWSQFFFWFMSAIMITGMLATSFLSFIMWLRLLTKIAEPQHIYYTTLRFIEIYDIDNYIQ